MTEDISVTTYVRHTVDRLTEVTRKPGQDVTIWDYVHLLNIISEIGWNHPDLVRAAADKAAGFYSLPPQSEVSA